MIVYISYIVYIKEGCKRLSNIGITSLNFHFSVPKTLGEFYIDLLQTGKGMFPENFICGYT